MHYSLSFAVFPACRYSCLVVLTSGCQTRSGKLVAVTVAQLIPCQLVQLAWMAYVTCGQCKALFTYEFNCFKMHNIRTYLPSACTINWPCARHERALTVANVLAISLLGDWQLLYTLHCRTIPLKDSHLHERDTMTYVYINLLQLGLLDERQQLCVIFG